MAIMKKLCLIACCVLALAGCGGNQQKLEKCMEDAGSVSMISGTADLQRQGCAGAAYGQSTDKRPECTAAVVAHKEWRKEAEERCVKLYK